MAELKIKHLSCMLKPANQKLIVSVQYDQKESIDIGGDKIHLAKSFSSNRRESMPVLCKVVEGNADISRETFLLVHHNRFAETSPHHLGDNLYSLAYNTAIFAKLDEYGNPIGLCDNIFVEHMMDDHDIVPLRLQSVNPFKYKVLNDGFGYFKGDVIFCYEKSNYEIIYVWNRVERRVTKVTKNDIVGKIKE